VSSVAGEPLTLADLDYDLPSELIAQTPVDPRDASRLLVVDRAGGSLFDHRFAELPALLHEGDLLVRNDTRVLPARTWFRRATGGRIEVLFLCAADRGEGTGGEQWEALLRGRPRAGERLANERLGDGWSLVCERRLGDGRWLVASTADRSVTALLAEAGTAPLPPYIHARLDDPERYQTTYCRAPGSAAAPTAGLHFTPALDEALGDAGVAIETVTLHVGLGTFKPLHAGLLAENTLHAERYEVHPAAWSRIARAAGEGRRIVAVGTTSLRVLEHLAAAPHPELALAGETSLFITPGHRFRLVGGLVTNFHLPRTSLLALVMALGGVELTRRAYRHAVRERYRFYSFGDAMLVL
jgi:S-adenosylmethionine:tRNA ribosyltransferase-isomerase